jgi:hypothetical protein
MKVVVEISDMAADAGVIPLLSMRADGCLDN